MTTLDSDAPAVTNAAPYSVSELSFALKRTLEDAYGFVRLRGEVSKVTRHSSGHVYLTLKDERACIDGVVWRTSVRMLKAQPIMGLEVIVTGKVTTFPSGSKYQIVIETLEPAGVGALLAQLERLKTKLAAEGLFATERKRPLPALPGVIGVVTSPTGAVIRDVLHRIRDRWPAHVLVWPVPVQGDSAAAAVAAAVRGFNALSQGGRIPRPDVLIVARGGGSVEDLWPFNDETLARTVADSGIPVISAVGHETDTTLIDFVSDRRAPTPTAAAEFATPVLAELRGAVADLERRWARAGGRTLEDRRVRLRAARLPRPADLLALTTQRHDLVAGRLASALERNAAVHERQLTRSAARLAPGLLRRPVELKAARLAELSGRLSRCAARSCGSAAEGDRLLRLGARLDGAAARSIEALAARVAGLDQVRRSLDPDRPLALGFARVNRPDGTLVRSGAALSAGDRLQLTFGDGKPVDAAVDGGLPAPRRARASAPIALAQGSLF